MTSIVGGLVKIAPSPPIYPSCTIAVAYSPSFVDVYVGGSHQPAASLTANDGLSIGLDAAALWMSVDSNYLGMAIEGQTQFFSRMGNITEITLSGTKTTAYTLSYYATNLVLVTFDPALPAGHVVVASGNVYLGGVIEVITVDTLGPTWTHGDDDPTTALVLPNGSLYSSATGSSPLWLTTGQGVWFAVALNSRA